MGTHEDSVDETTDLLRPWEDLSMLDDRQAQTILSYRNTSTDIQQNEASTVFHYSIDNTQPIDTPSVTEVLLDNRDIGTISRPNPLWGRCQQCASQKVVSATHTERRHLGSATIRCGACGARGAVYFHLNNGFTDHGWVADHSSWASAPRYRVTRARNRCYAPSYRRLDEVFEIMPTVPCKRHRSIISLDHKPQVWTTDDSLNAGLFLTEEAQQEWRKVSHNPHERVDFSKTEFNTLDPTIIAPTSSR